MHVEILAAVHGSIEIYAIQTGFAKNHSGTKARTPVGFPSP
jgi:hypothetical protein